MELNVAVTQNDPFDQIWLIRRRRCKQGKTFIFETKGLKRTTSWFNQKGEKGFIWVEENLICLEPKKPFSLQKESFFVGIDKFDKKAFLSALVFKKPWQCFFLERKFFFGSLWWTVRQFFWWIFQRTKQSEEAGKVSECGSECVWVRINYGWDKLRLGLKVRLGTSG